MEPEEEPCGAAVREVFEEVNKPKDSFCFTATWTESRLIKLAHSETFYMHIIWLDIRFDPNLHPKTTCPLYNRYSERPFGSVFFL